MPLDVIVLAAGQGKRMRSALPKVLHPLGGRPLLAHVLDAARAPHAPNTVVVHGQGAEAVRSAFADAGVQWVLQAEQLGTGHAVQQALPLLGGDGEVLILYGDVPLVRVANLERLVQSAGDGVAVMTTPLDDPRRYAPILPNGSAPAERTGGGKDPTPHQPADRPIQSRPTPPHPPPPAAP